MSVSKLAPYGIGTALFRIPRTRTLTVTTPSPFLFKPIPLPFLPLHHRASSSSSAAAEEETVSAVDQNHHPWPEWISFIDRLITKGYISKPSSSSGDGVYANINLLKDACPSFARDPYDLDKLLPSEDIQAVVEGGCPNLLCKAVNSAKRLRAHLRLDEGDNTFESSPFMPGGTRVLKDGFNPVRKELANVKFHSCQLPIIHSILHSILASFG